MTRLFFYILFFAGIQCCCNYTVALKPAYEYTITPDSLHADLQWQVNQIKVNDEVTLQSWTIFPKEGNKQLPTIIFANGDAGNMSNYVYQAGTLALNGYRVILFDYRGFGESTLLPFDEQMLYYDEFTQDLAAVYDYVQQTYAPKQMAIFGFSMGTIITQLAMAHQRIQPDYVVYDGLVTNPSLIKNRLYELNKVHVLLPSSAYSYVKNTENINTKMLLLSGTQDVITTPVDHQVYAAKKKKRRHIISYEGKHLTAFSTMTKDKYGDLLIPHLQAFFK